MSTVGSLRRRERRHPGKAVTDEVLGEPVFEGVELALADEIAEGEQPIRCGLGLGLDVLDVAVRLRGSGDLEIDEDRALRVACHGPDAFPVSRFPGRLARGRLLLAAARRCRVVIAAPGDQDEGGREERP